jgi:hypothetical protein
MSGIGLSAGECDLSSRGGGVLHKGHSRKMQLHSDALRHTRLSTNSRRVNWIEGKFSTRFARLLSCIEQRRGFVDKRWQLSRVDFARVLRGIAVREPR